MTSATRESTPARTRDRRLDVARGILISLVVFGHLLERSGGWTQDGTRLLLTVLYLFHMPAFVFLTGMTMKSDQILRRVGRLLSLLVVFEVLFTLLDAALGTALTPWYMPWWILWYVAAMVWWQLLIPFVRRFPRSAVVLACVIALAVGLIDIPGNVLAYSRAAFFLPFLVIGNLWGARILETLQHRMIVARAGVLLLFVVLAASIYALNLQPHWFFGNWGYGQLDVDPVTGMLVRAGLGIVAGIGVVAFLLWIPPRAAWIERPGRHSLAVFIFHAACVLVFAEFVGGAVTAWPLVPRLLLDAGLTVIVVAFFSLDVFERIVRWVAGIPERVVSVVRRG
ncbi:acyltransferase family protein [Leifsonia sp. Leaf264]|uniref:acyltransferase family protein n=1 Tax=Leifsonia sp. Leaf264 TaxID=1736314 RepID=UPI0006F7E336|nr:acyltransferase family protein [Leifsonia sp. Leaf264]KQO99453.1 hypothetical protein ASF30_05805 [Leifsonia sp. Leaf264]